MATFLELVQLLHQESGSTGVQPSSVVSQTGERKELVDYVANADKEIQTYWHNWKFLRDTTTFSETTIANQQFISKPATLNFWDTRTLRIDGQLIDVVEYEEVLSEVFDTTSRKEPSRIIIMPDRRLRLDPIPDGAYTFTGDFFKKPVKMTVNSSVSLIPEEFHETVILGKALIQYADSKNAGEIYDKGLRLYESNIGALESSQLPNRRNARYNSEQEVPIEVIAQ